MNKTCISMFKDDDNFLLPPDETKVWRYMDFVKFASILEKEALFFPTVQTLRNIDAWEGSHDNFEFAQYVGGDEESKQATKNHLYPITAHAARCHCAVNCWYAHDNESMAMWKLYSTSNEGIAIQTTVGRLKSCFVFDSPTWPKWPVETNTGDQPVLLRAGAVEYIDWHNPPANTNTIKQAAIYKSRLFEYEHELRVVAQLYPVVGAPHVVKHRLGGYCLGDPLECLSQEVYDQVKAFGGIYLPIRYETLIENVYISPIAGAWFIPLVESTLAKYKLGMPQWSNPKLKS